jgi:hypothetical protein
MFNKRQIAAAALVLAAALSGCGSDTNDSEASDTPESTSATPTTPETSATPTETPTTPATTPPAPTLGNLTLTPALDLTDQQKIQVDIANYGKFTGKAKVTLCTPEVLSDPNNSDNYCDTRPSAIGHLQVTQGAGTGTFTVNAGTSFKAGAPTSKCDPGGKCFVLAVSAGENPAYVSFNEVNFAG